jgi:DNA (cytosine-5)-methyltransferase 1
MVWDGVCLTAKVSESPNHASESSLWDAIEKGPVPDRYFLSPNAAKGMMRRADRMGRKLFPHLRESLEILAEKDQSSQD